MSNGIGDILSKLKSKYDIDMTEVMSNEEFQQFKVDTYNNSTGNLHEIDGYNCELCKNKGHFLVFANGYEVFQPCKCEKVRNMLRRAKQSGLGDVIKDCSFNSFEDTEEWQKYIKQTAQNFCNDDTAKWFYIGGQVGCGKSHICTAIAAHYIKSGRDVKYMVWADEAKKLKALVNDISYQSEIEPYKSVDILYIDDFFKVQAGETPTKGDINLAFEIINHRLLNNGKITIISSEKTLDELMDYDEGTMSRIYIKAGNYKINIAKDRNKNYRLRG